MKNNFKNDKKYFTIHNLTNFIGNLKLYFNILKMKYSLDSYISFKFGIIFLIITIKTMIYNTITAILWSFGEIILLIFTPKYTPMSEKIPTINPSL